MTEYLDITYPDWREYTNSTILEMAKDGDVYGLSLIHNILDPNISWQDVANMAARYGHDDIIDYIDQFYTVNHFALADTALTYNQWDTALDLHGPYYDTVPMTGTGEPDPPTFTQVYDEDFDFEEPQDYLEEFAEPWSGTKEEVDTFRSPPFSYRVDNVDVEEDVMEYHPEEFEPVLIRSKFLSRPMPAGYEFDDEDVFGDETLDPLEFPERYPGMVGFQPQIEYDPDGSMEDYDAGY